MAQHLSEDVVKLILDGESSKLQQAAHQAAKAIREVEEENRTLLERQKAMRKSKITEGKEWDDLSKKISINDQKIRQHKNDLQALTKEMGVNTMTMSQLRKEAKSLQRQLDNTSKELEPKQYELLAGKLSDVKNRMNELKGEAKELMDTMVSGNAKGFLIGTGIVRAYDFIKNKMTELISTSLELAESADGVQHAFAQLDNGDELLAGLRKATKGTVNDFELMKAAMKAKDFKIPLEDLGKLLSFAQLKAQQTGQSVDYMVDSIVTGLGRQSKMILDNLGISAAEIDEKIQETGDFAKAVASIVNTQLAEAGDKYVSAADRALQKTTELQNKQLELGKALLSVKEDFVNSYGEIVITLMNALKWIVTHKKETGLVALAFTGLTVAVIANNAAVRAHVAETKAAILVNGLLSTGLNTLKGVYLLLAAAVNTLRGNTLKATAQMRLFNMTCKANVVMLLVTGVIALGAALYAFMSRQDAATEHAKRMREEFERMNTIMKETRSVLKKDIQDVEKKSGDQAVETATKIKILRQTIEDETKSNKKRLEALNNLRSIVPAYHAELTIEGKLIKNNTNALNDYITNLKRTAQAQAVVAKMTEIAQQEMDNQIERQHDLGVRNHLSNTAYRQGVNLHKMEVRERKVAVVNQYGGTEMRNTGQYEVVDRATKRVVKGLENVGEGLFNLYNRFEEQSAKLDRHDAQTRQNNMRTGQMEDFARRNNLDLTSPSNTSNTPQIKPTKTGGSGGTKDDSKAIDDFKRARQKELDIQKRIYEEQLIIFKRSLAERKITREEYDTQALAAEIAYKDNVLKVEQDYQDQSQQLVIKDAQKKKDIQDDQRRNTAKAMADADQAMEQAYIRHQDRMQKMMEAALSPAQKEKMDRDAQLKVLEAYYNASMEYAKENGESVMSIVTAYALAISNLKKLWADADKEKHFRARSSAGLTTVQEEHEHTLSDIDSNTELSPEERDEARLNAEREYQERLLQVRQEYGLVKQQELYDQELEQLRQAKEQGYLTEEEYEKAKTQMKMDQYKQQFDYYKGLFSNAVNALQDAELANVEAKYDAEIDAAKKAGKDTSKLEEKAAEEKLKIQKKYADVQFAIRASEIIADTAQAIIATHKSLGGWTPWAIAAAALMGVTGAAQLAVAAAERNKVKSMTLKGSSGSSSTTGARIATGKEEGGFLDVEREQDGKRFHAKYDPNRRGYVDRPTVIVGEGPAGQSKEWIASNAAVENPTVRPILDILDRHQRAGSVRTLDLNKYLLQQRGYAQGGSIANTPLTSPAGTGISPELMERFVGVMERMERDGIPAILGLDEIDAKNKLRDKSRDIGSK